MAEVIIINPREKIDIATDEIKVAAYVRVSSDSEDQENSFITQYDYYVDKINKTPEYKFVDIYADDGITGTELEKRDEFNRMYIDCAKGMIDLILVKSISRFARNTYDCIDMVRKLKNLGTNVIFEKEKIDTRTMTSEVELAALSSMAQEESVSLSKNVRLGIQFRMKNGTFKQGNLPYGYTLGDDGNWVIVEEQAKIVRLIFNAYIGGTSLRKIANELSKAGIIKNDGTSKWSGKTISYIIRNEKYMGDALLQKSYTDDFPFKSHLNRGEKDMYHVKNHNVPIVSEEIFRKANNLLDEQGSRYYRENRPQSDSVLSKIMFCEECGTMFRRKSGTINVYWVCRKRDHDASQCPTPQVAETVVCNGFVNIYNRLVNNVEIILTPMLGQLSGCKETRLRSKGEIENINKEIANITEQILVLGKANADGYIESALFMQESNDLNMKLAKLKKDKKMILGNDECDKAYKKTEQLINILKKTGPIGEFDKKTFKRVVNRIYISKDKVMTYELINGMKIKLEYSEV